MKRKIIFLALFIAVAVFAQAQVSVKEVKSNMSQGIQPAYYVMIPEVDQKFVEKEWKSFIRNYRGKVSKSDKNEYFVDDVEIKKVFSNPIDIYLKVDENKDGTGVTLFYKTGEIFIDKGTHKELSEQATELTTQFAVSVMKAHAEELIDEEEKNLKKMENEMKNLERQESKLTKKIEDCQDDIKKAESDLKSTQQDKKKQSEELAKQKKLVDERKDRLKKIK